ncbi:MAG TPA: hypothetical protein VIS99_03280, partial [Terrimicrobiaceae bacterium]
HAFQKRNHDLALSSRPLRKLKCAVCLLLLAFMARSSAEEIWHLLIEPTFMRYESAWPIAGAERTVLVPARFVNGEVLPLQHNEVLNLRASRDEILASAPKAAAEVLAGLTPRFLRDKNRVIQYAVLESESPLTASAVLAPDFSSLFSDTLGPDVLVAIPNRFRIFVFPRGTQAYQRLSELIIAEYDSSTYPVSKELFTVRNGRLSAVGSYR